MTTWNGAISKGFTVFDFFSLSRLEYVVFACRRILVVPSEVRVDRKPALCEVKHVKKLHFETAKSTRW